MENLAFKIEPYYESKQQAIQFGESDLFSAIKDDYTALGLVGEDHNKLMCYLAAVSHVWLDSAFERGYFEQRVPARGPV